MGKKNKRRGTNVNTNEKFRLPADCALILAAKNALQFVFPQQFLQDAENLQRPSAKEEAAALFIKSRRRSIKPHCCCGNAETVSGIRPILDDIVIPTKSDRLALRSSLIDSFQTLLRLCNLETFP